MEEKIPIEQPYERMKQIFSKYSTSNLNYTDYLEAMGNCFDNNPFIKTPSLNKILMKALRISSLNQLKLLEIKLK